MSSPDVPAIAESDGSLEGHGRTLSQMKENLEWAFGRRGGRFAGFARVLVSDGEPRGSGVSSLPVGTLWIDTANSNKLHVWLGRSWEPVT